MGVDEVKVTSDPSGSRPRARPQSVFHSIKFFVLCHSLLQLAQLLVSGYMKSSISTIERRYGLSSQKSGLLAAFNEVGNTILIIFVSFFGSRVHRPRFIGGGAVLAGLASLLMALPHFLSGLYDYSSHTSSASSHNSTGLCQSTIDFSTSSSNQSCSRQQSPAQERVYPLLLLAQLLLGVAAVPIQPFGISYIDDHASKRNSPLYLGIVFAVTSIGPALGFITGSLMLRFYVDFDKLSTDEIRLDSRDLRWVGAWWLGFLVASGLLFLAALPYLFFPRVMPREDGADDAESKPDEQQQTNPLQHLSLVQFLKSFPRIALRTLQSPIFLLVVLAQVNLAALLAGLATFMAKFIERQFSQTIPFSTMMIGGVGIPMAVLGAILGGVLMRRLNLSVSGASKLCTIAILLCVFSSVPLLLIGCSTQRVAGVFPPDPDALSCSSSCGCPQDVFNPVCGSDGVEFRSPCHAGCNVVEMANHKVTNYTECRCVPGLGHAAPGTCGSGCAHLLRPFMVLLGITSFIASFSQTPSYIMILRTVPTEDKSFAVGVQYMLFRVLAFMPGPVLYGSVIDTTCLLWGRKCDKQTSCLYYNLDRFRQRFLGLQVVFVCGGLLCFLLTIVVLRRTTRRQEPEEDRKGEYELVTEQKTPAPSSRGTEEKGMKT
ncbi:solute carrier organic anion transporter family member 2B1 isoform X1 [Hippoglossus hippoglossus]|uniref:solute carrier organic anion transporter family member 2B1 isoform X1 n=2 Tax=Hippoglossus hippoglossus TaxID=8267 RepID=UPI00148B4FEF|nr:solute carrier organic anion transporter family member 2B1 isoform X1 [Hippoglossus hippoglossus]XP_034463138.1 solute carrier organic anion transporter family member 2B1 isoform X1 [Hippoglossus hippoglossus]XP_034463140.1 solute carrier organic anion transporter family member 2B1 isoform X1 [Hippoglossus hippoglossus]